MKQTYNIPAIHCASCVMLLEELEDEPGINSITVNLHKRQAQVEFDETKLDQEKVASKIEQISGYKASIHE